MGIKGLAKLLSDEAPDSIRDVELKSLQGRKIAIDASMAIYQFLIAVRSGGGNQAAVMLTNADGETTSHIQGMFNRTIRFLTEGIKPVFVFDGKPPNLKSGELQKRRNKRQQAEAALKAATDEGNIEEQDKHSKRLVRAGHKENADCKRLLELMGVPVVVAPCEAEAQASALCKAGVVYATATEDMDALTFQTPVLLRKMTFANGSKSVTIQSMSYDKAIQGLGITHAQFVDLCILLGCDYCDTIKGVGPKTALKLVRDYLDIEHILPVVRQNPKYVVPPSWLKPEEREADKKDKKEDDDNDSREESENIEKEDEENAEASSLKKVDNDEENAEADNGEFVPAFVLARKLFNEHEVLSKDEVSSLIKWKPCQAEELKKFLVDEMGFSAERVDANIEKLQAAYKNNLKPQMRMDQFFTVKPSSSAGTKRKAPTAPASTAKGKKKPSTAGKRRR
ncbi:hypothetical protein ACA910_003830 [Epithemia clementina (nom. ined.)]